MAWQHPASASQQLNNLLEPAEAEVRTSGTALSADHVALLPSAACNIALHNNLNVALDLLALTKCPDGDVVLFVFVVGPKQLSLLLHLLSLI